MLKHCVPHFPPSSGPLRVKWKARRNKNINVNNISSEASRGAGEKKVTVRSTGLSCCNYIFNQ